MVLYAGVAFRPLVMTEGDSKSTVQRGGVDVYLITCMKRDHAGDPSMCGLLRTAAVVGLNTGPGPQCAKGFMLSPRRT